jgi:hypothetical protein
MKQFTRKATRRIHTAPVVLDTVGMVRRRRGHATLRLTIVGPIEKLQSLQMQEGDRLRVHAGTVAMA